MEATSNILTFTGRIEKMAESIGVKASLVQKKVAMDLHREIKRRTPVRFGVARANWHLTVGAPSTEMIGYPNKEGVSYSDPPTPDIDNGDGSKPIYCTNNLPYIARLNEGWSKQAPAAFVESAMAAEAARLEAGIKSFE